MFQRFSAKQRMEKKISMAPASGRQKENCECHHSIHAIRRKYCKYIKLLKIADILN